MQNASHRTPHANGEMRERLLKTPHLEPIVFSIKISAKPIRLRRINQWMDKVKKSALQRPSRKKEESQSNGKAFKLVHPGG